MTATTDSDGHPEITEISDLTEGLLPPSRTSEVRRHLDGCELCADVYASLEEIRGMLGTLPGPPRMPADVAGRIDAALAAEALLNATAPDGPPSTDVPPESEPQTETETESEPALAAPTTSVSARVSRETSPAPVSGTAADRPADRPAGRPRAATGPGRGARPRRTRRRTAVLGAVFTAAAIGLGSLLMQTWGGDSDGASVGHRDTADSFSEGKLKGRVADLLAKSPVKEPRGGKSEGAKESDGSKPSFDTRSTPESPTGNSPLRGEAVQVPECIQRGIGSRTPLAAEQGSYEGKRAYLVVVPHDSDAGQVSAYIVDATCVGKSSPSAGKVLLTHSYPQG
ncbi:hypothetical protein DMA15_18635 [Streptomyces sp. WAC 01529]|uniref:anti-sigma factor family protein n=1 Tax=Streptomyces sp. WAC 01529 TaxID=2203205 RepID=UPI000F70C2CC|nr:hypothetical protein [Streptomyces sp. WAC 01529]AZM54331.1 hypothetical protein DMA15_18635 [Streptomyces sp. WAC 01529]